MVSVFSTENFKAGDIALFEVGVGRYTLFLVLEANEFSVDVIRVGNIIEGNFMQNVEKTIYRDTNKNCFNGIVGCAFV